MRITLSIDDDLAHSVEDLRDRQELSLREAIDQLLRAGLRAIEKAPDSGPYAGSVFNSDLNPDIDPNRMNQLADKLEIEESLAFRAKFEKQPPGYCGGMTQAQIAWMKTKIEAARDAGERVILFNHFPLLPDGAHNLWNDTELLDTLAPTPGRSPLGSTATTTPAAMPSATASTTSPYAACSTPKRTPSL